MALSIEMTGSGNIGDIAPNWTVQEGATPVTIGDTGSRTGTVSLSARSTDSSLMCINNDVISTIDGLGTLHGIVQSVNESGPSVNLVHGTLLDKFNLDVNMPAIIGADAGTVLDYAEQKVLLNARTTKTVGDFYSLNGHNFSFINDNSGNAVYQEATSTPKEFSYTIPGQSTISYKYNDIRHSVDVNSFKRISGQVYANAVNGKQFFSTTGFSSSAGTVSSKMYFKTKLNGEDTNLILFGKPISLSLEWYLECNLNISYINKTITLQGIYAPGGTSTPFTVTQSIAGLNVDNELGVFVDFWVTGSGVFKMLARVCNTSNYSTFVSVNKDFSYGMCPIFDYFQLTGNVRSLYTLTNSSTYTPATPAEYEIPSVVNVSVADTAANKSIVPASAYKGVLWEYLQMACAARNQEIYVNADQVYVADVGSRTINIDNVVGSPTITPTSTLSGKQINIPYTNAYFIGETINSYNERVQQTIYDASADNNNVISVAAGETTVVSIKYDTNPIVVSSPLRADSYPVTAGYYNVCDSSGLNLYAGEWEEYGGSVVCEIDPDDSSAIRITVTGPRQETTVAGGPYKLAASSGNTDYASLKIAGTGVYFGDKKLELITGIDPQKYTRATVNTITNPFIGSLEMAYDRGVWASLKASGPVVTLSATIPSRDLTSIGETSGSLFNYRDSTYRIVSNSVTNIGSNINAERHVVINNIDNLWGSKTVAQYDSVWGSYECQDQIIFPYMGA